MAIAIDSLGFNDLGRSVTFTFLFRHRFNLQLSPHYPKMNKKSMWEVKKISLFLSARHQILPSCGLKVAPCSFLPARALISKISRWRKLSNSTLKSRAESRSKIPTNMASKLLKFVYRKCCVDRLRFQNICRLNRRPQLSLLGVKEKYTRHAGVSTNEADFM